MVNDKSRSLMGSLCLLLCVLCIATSVSCANLPKMGMNVAIGQGLPLAKVKSANNVIVDTAGFVDKATDKEAVNDIVELDYDPFINKANGVMKPLYDDEFEGDQYDEEVGLANLVAPRRSKRSVEAAEGVEPEAESQRPLVRKRRCGGGGDDDDDDRRIRNSRRVRRVVRRRVSAGNGRNGKVKKIKKMKKSKRSKKFNKSNSNSNNSEDEDETHEVVVTTKKVIKNGVVVSQTSSESQPKVTVTTSN